MVVQSISRTWLFETHGLQHARAHCPSLAPRICPSSCPMNRWCHQPSHPLLPSSPLALNLSQHQDLFQWVSFLHQVAKVLELQLSISPSNEYSGLISFRTDWSPCSPRDSQESSPTPQFKSINSLALSFLYSPTLTSICDYWKTHSLD